MINKRYYSVFMAVLFYTLFIFVSESFSSVRNEIQDKKVHFMGFQKMEVNDTIVSINDPSVFKNVDSNLIEIFDSIQLEYGQPLKVKYGYRDYRTNRMVGGARNSAHLYGKALDIYLDRPSRESIKKLITISSKYNVLGIGVYSDAQVLHIDIDSTKGRRVWGSSYSSRSVPRWAMIEVKQHLSKKSETDSIQVKSVEPKVQVKAEDKVEIKKEVKKVEPKVEIKKEDKKVEPKVKEIKKDSIKIEYYTVKKGDTVYSLAKNNQTTVENLCRINNIENYNIKIGQKIRLN